MTKNRIIVPVSISGRLTGFDVLTATPIREEATVVDFDLTDTHAYIPKFINAQAGKDKIAPSYNILMQLVVDDDKSALTSRLKGDPAAVMMTFGELSDIILPDAEKVQKKPSTLPTSTNSAD